MKLGIASAAVLVLAGGAAALLQEGGLRHGRLGPSARSVVAAVGVALLDGTLPQDRAAKQVALDGLLGRTNALILALPPHTQSELSQLLALLANSTGRRLVAGLETGWEDASIDEIQQAMQGMRISRLALRQQTYHALHDIVGGAYFSDPGTWGKIGYPGPLKI